MTETTTPETNNKLVIAKKIARFVAVRSVSGVVVTVIHQNVSVASKPAKVQLYIGAFLLGSMAADAAWDHAEQQIDEVVTAVREARAQSKDTAHVVTDL